MKKWFLFVGIFISIATFAIENEQVALLPKIKLTANIDMVSSHVWRGGKSGLAPSIEPYMELGIGNFTLGSWAAATFDNKYRELDIYGLYTIGNFSLGIYDYYCPPEMPEKSKFTDFHGIDTYHLFSIDMVYYGTQKLPVKLTASTMLYGMDFDLNTGEYFFSTYLEAIYTKSWKSNSVSALIGFTTHRGIYADHASIMNSEIVFKKSFFVGEFSIPVFAKLVYNPYSNQAWAIGGVSVNRIFEF